MRLLALQSLMSNGLATYWLSRSHHELPVSRGPARFSHRYRPPLSCEKWVHPLMHSCFSLEFVFAPCLPATRKQLITFHEVSPSIATSIQRVHHSASQPGLPSFRSQCSTHSQRFTPLRTLQACFILQPRPRFTFQGFSPPASRCSSSLHRSLMTLAKFIYCRVTPTAPTSSAPSTRL
jgi:hypothetical protein